MSIANRRKQIDAIDRKLLRLLNGRARIAVRLGGLKKTAGLPLCDPARERHILVRARQWNSGPLDSRAVTSLFKQILHECRRMERRAVKTNVLHGERRNA
ncbi:MAG: chorismate mutase [Acidobacteria bacterium]|nr:chorismate mutase [Acidobacteriota bacterium]